MIKTMFVIPALLVGAAVPAAPVVDLDFSQAATGVFPNRCKPGSAAMARTVTGAYGRLRGESALNRADKRYGSAATDRKGAPRAFRLGDAGNYLRNIGFAPETGKPFTVELWFNIYAPQPYFGGNIFNANMGWATGFRLDYVRATWAKEGMFVFSHGGDEKVQSRKIIAKKCTADEWHQLVIVSTGKSIALYLDGQKLGENPGTVKFEKNWAQLNVGARAEALVNRGIGMDFKLDGLYADDSALPAAEIAARYEAGKPGKIELSDADCDAAEIGVPHDTFGYFPAGRTIPLTFKGGDRLLLDGKPAPKELNFTEPGLRRHVLTVEKNGKAVREQPFVFGVVSALPGASRVGANDSAARSPESTVLGADFDRVTVDWARLEPKKQEYDWSELDEIIKRNDAAKRQTVICLTGIPWWLKRSDADKNLPSDMEAYRKIWRLLVSRYDGVNHFEVWKSLNWHNSMQGTPEQRIKSYAELLNVAAPAIRSENENAKILIGGVWNADPGFLQKLLAAIPAERYDIVTVQDDAPDSGDTARWSRVTALTKKPVWNTASGAYQALPDAPGDNRYYPVRIVEGRKHAADTVRSLAAQFASGIERVFLFTGPSEYGPAVNGENGNPGWKGLALAQFNREVGPNAKLEKIASAPGTAAFRYSNPDGRSGVVAFALRGNGALTLPGTAHEVVDLFGRAATVSGASIPLTESPVYIHSRK